MRANRTPRAVMNKAMHRTLHRAMMAMAATGILTALAPVATAQAAPDAEAKSLDALNMSVMDMGITTAMGDKVVQAAFNELNSDHRFEWGTNCNFYSEVWYGRGRCQAWCADFVKYVWKNAGVFAWDSLDSEAGTTARYGAFFGTWHPGGSGAGIYPGAAVTYDNNNTPLSDAEHVGIFVGWQNGVPKVISGNYNNGVYKHNLHYSSRNVLVGWTGVG
jgi:hypothetical protein